MSRPTHCRLDDEGNMLEVVFPDGCPDAVELPEGFWDARDLETARAEKWGVAKAKRFAVEQGGAPTPLGIMDSDTVSQGKITGTVVMAQLAVAQGLPFEQAWTMADDSVVVHDAAQMIAAGMAVGQHVVETHAVAHELRQLIDAAETVEAIEAIDIEGAPWPSNG